MKGKHMNALTDSNPFNRIRLGAILFTLLLAVVAFPSFADEDNGTLLGRLNDSKHSLAVLIELIGDATNGTCTPDTEVFEDKKHLTGSAMQLTLVQLSKLTLVDAIKKAEAAEKGTVYSVIPSVKDGSAVYDVLVAAEGKSVHLVVDGKTGKVSH